MGMLQESKAEKALDALKSMSAPHARVLRDGTEQIIDAASLVPGDIILLETGDFVPADARLLHSASLKSEESALTGESVPAEKDAPAPVWRTLRSATENMVFSGTGVTYGTATAVVTATGMQTEMGKIAAAFWRGGNAGRRCRKSFASSSARSSVCRARRLRDDLCGRPDERHRRSGDLHDLGFAWRFRAIPEGLPAIVTIVLSIGVQRMVKKNAIIRRLPAVETLGSASVICSDKTGTLTQNRMTLQKAYLDGAAEIIDSGDAAARTLAAHGGALLRRRRDL
jgi:Ca2+-transporting ATPase